MLPPTSLEIAPEGTGYRLRMRVGQQQRELTDSDCRALLRAAVVVAVAVTLSESSQRPANENARERSANDSFPREREASAVTSASSVELSAALGGGFTVGLLPRIAAAFDLQAKSVWHERLGLALAAHYVARTTEEYPGGRGLTVDAAGAQVSGVYRLNGYLEAQLGGAISRLAGTGIGSGSRSDSAWAAGPNAGVGFLPLRRGVFWAGVLGTLQWNALRPSFEFLNHGPIFTVSRYSFSLFLQVGPRFP